MNIASVEAYANRSPRAAMTCGIHVCAPLGMRCVCLKAFAISAAVSHGAPSVRRPQIRTTTKKRSWTADGGLRSLARADAVRGLDRSRVLAFDRRARCVRVCVRGARVAKRKIRSFQTRRSHDPPLGLARPVHNSLWIHRDVHVGLVRTSRARGRKNGKAYDSYNAGRRRSLCSLLLHPV